MTENNEPKSELPGEAEHLSENCAEVDRQMAALLNGYLDAELSVHVADCDRCRDLKFELEQAAQCVADAAADYRHPANFEGRVLDAVDRTILESARTELRSAAPASAETAASRSTHPSRRLPGVGSGDEASYRSQMTPRNQRRRLPWLASLAAAAVVVWMVWPGARQAGQEHGPSASPGTPLAWAGTVAQVVSGFASRDGLEACHGDWDDCQTLAVGAPVVAGTWLRTDGLTRAQLQMADGSLLSLDRATELKLSRETDRTAALVRGDIIADVHKLEGEKALLELPRGRVEVIGTKFALHADDQVARVDVSRGEVRLVDDREREVAVHAGQGGRLYVGRAPEAEALMSLGDSFSWGDQAFASETERDETPRGLGELRAKKPGDDQERRDAVRLTRHAVKVRVVESMARTEIEEVFTNLTDDQLEGVFRFPLPADAQIERLALEVDGHMEEGAFVDRERAAAIWRGAIVNSSRKPPPVRDEIVWVPGPWKDPALLQWEGGGRFELRIFPIPKRGSRRIVLAYTQKLKPAGDVIRYTYPLAHDPSGSTRVEDFSVDVQVQGHEGSVSARGYELERVASDLGGPRDARERLALHRRDFSPAGDVTLEFRLPEANRHFKVWAYKPGSDEPSSDASYVAFALQPDLPVRHVRSDRAYVIVVDRSRSMYGEQYRRATAVTSRIVAEMDRNDRVAVLDCDSECAAFATDFREPSPTLTLEVERYLSQVVPEGASDLVNVLREASQWTERAGGRELQIVYIGDGTPTVGEVRPALIRKALQRSLPNDTRISALTVGNDSDLLALQTVTDAAGGVVVRYTPGQSVGEAALALLGATYGHGLRNAELTLPEGFTRVAPKQLGTIAAGAEVVVVARMDQPTLAGRALLRGSLAGQPFERSYEFEAVATAGESNAFVPRLFASAQIAELERLSTDEARAQIVALSGKFNVASRYTSLLVLESPAMFKAFGLDNRRSVPLWSGELASTGSQASASTMGHEALGGAADWDDEVSESGLGSSQGVGSYGYQFDDQGLSAPKSGASRSRPAPARSAPKPRSAARDKESKRKWEGPLAEEPLNERWAPPPPPQRRRMIPMRRVWRRHGKLETPPEVLEGTASDALSDLEQRLRSNPLSRDALQALYSAYVRAGDLDKASDLAERWSDKDPLDPAALTARADVAAQRGQRALAIRILGSVIDVRPSEYKAQWRLARLKRWAGQAQAGCRHSLSAFEFRPADAKLLGEAVRCARDTGQVSLAEDLMESASQKTRQEAQGLLLRGVPDPESLSGDFQVEATWDGAHTDLDLVIIHPDGYRVSWLGAPTRAVISAKDVLSVHREGLALRGAKPGHYAIEVVRGDASQEAIRGEVQLRIGGVARSVPFNLEADRLRVATAKIQMRSELVPLR